MPFIPLHDTSPRYLIARPWTTWLLILATVLVFVAQVVDNADGLPQLIYGLGTIPATLIGTAELPPRLTIVDPLVTLITSQFLHGGFMHLAGNMLYLWVFGDNVEDAMGHYRFLAFYLLCGAIAALAHVVSDPASTSPAIGASGAISGVLGAYLVLHPKSRILVPVVFIPLYLPAWLLLVFWFGFQFFAAFGGSGASSTAWWAHIGGFAAGVVLVFAFRYKAVPLFGLGDPPGGVTIRRGAKWQPRNAPPGTRNGPWE